MLLTPLEPRPDFLCPGCCFGHFSSIVGGLLQQEGESRAKRSPNLFESLPAHQPGAFLGGFEIAVCVRGGGGAGGHIELDQMFYF